MSPLNNLQAFLTSSGGPWVGIVMMARPGGRGVVRMGLLGRSGAGACPNLLQRRSTAGSAAEKSAEYQRFSSRIPARSEPLQQIWTNGAPAGPGRGAAGRAATTAGAAPASGPAPQDEAHGLAAGGGVAQQAAHRARHRTGAGLVDAAHGHAQVLGLDDDEDALGA